MLTFFINLLSLLNCCISPFERFAHNFGTLDAVLKEGGFIPLVQLGFQPGRKGWESRLRKKIDLSNIEIFVALSDWPKISGPWAGISEREGSSAVLPSLPIPIPRVALV